MDCNDFRHLAIQSPSVTSNKILNYPNLLLSTRHQWDDGLPLGNDRIPMLVACWNDFCFYDNVGKEPSFGAFLLSIHNNNNKFSGILPVIVPFVLTLNSGTFNYIINFEVSSFEYFVDVAVAVAVFIVVILFRMFFALNNAVCSLHATSYSFIDWFKCQVVNDVIGGSNRRNLFPFNSMQAKCRKKNSISHELNVN